MNKNAFHELLYQVLETAQWSVRVYEAASRCVRNVDLEKAWLEHSDGVGRQERALQEVFKALALDPSAKTGGRERITTLGRRLVEGMETALEDGNTATAEIVAAECVVEIEAKAAMYWDVIGERAKRLVGVEGAAVKAAHAEVAGEQQRRLYYTTGWVRELWISALGMPAVLPPPEHERRVTSAIGAARARQSRAEML
jgi:hypothetical protein